MVLLSQNFQGTGHDVRGNDGGHGFRGLVDIVEDRHHGFVGRWRRNQFEHDLVEHAQGAFTGHLQTGQIQAGHAFDGARAGLDEPAGHVKKVHAHHVILGHTVLEAAQAAGVFSHVAADRRHGHGARIRGIEKPLFGHFGGKLGRYHAGLNHGVKVLGVDFDDFVERVDDWFSRLHVLNQPFPRTAPGRRQNSSWSP